MKIYLAGGAIRDFLLGLCPKEFDYAFAGTIEDFLRLYPSAQKAGRSIEVVIYKGMDFMPLRGGNLEQDLKERDLTINALLMEECGIIHAHPMAFADLANGILRPTSENAFFIDPLRVFRVARFAATLANFTVHEDCITQMQQVAAQNLLQNLPVERVGRELLKALKGAHPAKFLKILAAGNCLCPWFVEVAKAANIPAGPLPWHNNSVFEHSCDVVDILAKNENLSNKNVPDKNLAIWLALTHDLGKIESPIENLPHHYGHEKRGESIAFNLATRLALPSKFIKGGALAAKLHMKAGQYFKLRVGTRCDLLMQIHKAGLTYAFWQFVDADSNSSISEQAYADLEIILKVSLPLEWQNKGLQSAMQLRLVRCAALVAAGIKKVAPE